MPLVQYFGVQVGEAGFDPARADATSGRFLALGDPLPVGTTIEIDGHSHRVTRVDEGMAPGVWVQPSDGRVVVEAAPAVTAPATPTRVDAEVTAPSPPPAEALADDTGEEGPATTPSMPVVTEAALAGDGKPEATDGSEPSEPADGSGRTRRKRKGGNRKTTTGR